ncbi:MAG: aldehyde dehydrogenase, partial [Myxococcales bacterium]|nr:aldehyde dehydrogenase [Myxococcales bacterium]
EPLVRHKGVRAVDLWNVDGEQAKKLEEFAADNVKRVQRRVFEELDWYDTRTEGPSFIESFVEIKTVWHPMGA